MRLPQFSLKTLAGMVAFAAVACCSLIYASQAWSAVLYTAAIVLLAFATLAAAYHRQRVRAFWLGCAVCGWLYVLLVLGPLPGTRQMASPGQLNIDSELATTHLARWVYANVLPKLRTPPSAISSVKLKFAPQGASGEATLEKVYVTGSGVVTRLDVDTVLSVVTGETLATLSPASAVSRYPDETSFVRVSHALWTWLFALAGGLAGSWLYSRQTAQRPTIAAA
jgi:hypothetical protein